MPGGVKITVRPQRTSAGSRTYSLPNIHGDVFATIDADGSILTTQQTGPFGEQLPNQSTAWNTVNGATMGYVGSTQKLTEAQLAIRPVQMGARIYIPGLGRFLQVDPIQGGTPNNYTYPTDPVNDFDLSGMFSISFWSPKQWEKDKKFAKKIWQVRNDFIAWQDKHPRIKEAMIMLASRGAAGKGGSMLKPGAYAKESIPSPSTSQRFSVATRNQINDIGERYGCHTCGSASAGTKSGNWVPDHQPVTRLNVPGKPQDLYPQCISCSRIQGGQVRTASRYDDANLILIIGEN